MVPPLAREMSNWFHNGGHKKKVLSIKMLCADWRARICSWVQNTSILLLFPLLPGSIYCHLSESRAGCESTSAHSVVTSRGLGVSLHPPTPWSRRQWDSSVSTLHYSYLERKANQEQILVLAFQPHHCIFAALVFFLLLTAFVVYR